MENENRIQTEQTLNEMEIDTIGEILNISMGSAATAVSTLLGRTVNITTPTVTVVKSTELGLDSLNPSVGIEIEYVEGLSGNNLLVMKRKDIKSIVDLLLGEMDDTDDDTMDEMHVSAVSEIMNQMMGASSTALSSFLGKSINISTPKQFDIHNKVAEIGSDTNNTTIATVKFMLDVENLLCSEFVTIMPIDFIKDLVKSALNFDDAEVTPPKETKVSPPVQQPVEQPAMPPKEKVERIEKAEKDDYRSNTATAVKKESVNVKPVKMPSFDDDIALQDEEETDNFQLIMGVPLDVSVEIGRTKMSVKNILDVRQGSIVELDRQAGDPVDVIVNGQLIAKGDVVIVDDNFGVRITEILSKKGISKKLN